MRLFGVDDAAFLRELRARGVRLDAEPPLDLVFLAAASPGDLDCLTGLRALLAPNGAIWVVRAKGDSRRVGEMDIIDAGKRQGLVDNKIASFSDTLSAMRLVIPRAQRSKPGGE